MHGNTTHIHGYPPKPYPLWRRKHELTRFGFGFGFFSISKDGVGAGNGDIDTHPEHVLLILKLDFISFKLKILKLHSYVYFLSLIWVLNKLFSLFLSLF
jgi:hypothetical protein